MPRSRLQLALIVLTVCLAAQVPWARPALARRTPRCGAKELTLELKTDRKRYAAGRAVDVTMRVKNTSGAACRAVFPSSQRANLLVFRNGRRIWDSDRCYAFTDAIVSERWGRGHQDVYRWTWRQKNNRKHRKACGTGPADDARPGAYVVRGNFYGAYYKSGVLHSPRVRIRVG